MRCYLRQFPRRSVAHSLNNTSLTSFYSCICPLRSNFYTSAKVLSLWCSDCAAIIGQPICSFSLLSVGRFINRHTPVNANFLQHIHRLGLLMKNFWSFSDCCSFFWGFLSQSFLTMIEECTVHFFVPQNFLLKHSRISLRATEEQAAPKNHP